MGTCAERGRRRVAEGVLGSTVVLIALGSAWPDGGTGAIWAAVAMAAVTVALYCTTGTQRTLRSPGAVPLVLGCSWLATFACVPETSDQMFHVAALLVVLGVSELATRSTLPWWAHSGATAVVAWAGLYGSAGRETAIVGALFALWPLVLPTITAAVVPSFTTSPPWMRWCTVAIAAVASLACARSGGIGTSTWSAVEDAVVAATVSSAAALPLARWSAQRPRDHTIDTTNIAP